MLVLIVDVGFVYSIKFSHVSFAFLEFSPFFHVVQFESASGHRQKALLHRTMGKDRAP